MGNKVIRVIKNSALNLWCSRLSLIGFIAGLTISVAMIVNIFQQRSFFELAPYQYAALSFIIAVVCLVLYLFIFRPLNFTKIALYEDSFVVYRGSATEKYSYLDVVKIVDHGRYYEIKFIGAKSFYFNYKLERAEYIIELIAKVNAKPFKKQKVKTLRDPLFHSSMGLARMKIFFAESRSFILAQIVLMAVFFILTHQKQSHFFSNQIKLFAKNYLTESSILLWTLNASLMFIFVFYCQYIQRQRLSKDVMDKRRDVVFESQLIKKLNILSVVCFLGYAVGMLRYDTNLYQLVKIRYSIDGTKSALALVDMRYKCLECSHSINTDLEVVTESKETALIKSVAGNEVVLKRSPAANSRSVVVPVDSALIDVSGVEKIVPIDSILGKKILQFPK